MTSFFQALLNFSSGEDVIAKLVLALLILVFGHLAVKLTGIGLRRTWIKSRELSKKEVKERNETLRYFKYLLDAFVIVFALFYLNTDLTTQISSEFVNFLPQLFSVILIGLLGLIAINISIKVATEFLKTMGVQNYFREVGLSGSTINVVAVIVKGFLYLLLLQIALKQIGIGDTFVNELVMASSWAAALLIAALLFYGFKDLFRNFAAGVYLKNSRLVRPGEEVRLEEETGEIRDIALFSTTVNTETGYTLLTPNTKIMESELKFKRTKNDIETLEEIKRYFVSEHAAFCGPASMEMVLDIFGYRHPQEEIAEEAGIEEGETIEPVELAEIVESLTDEEVRTGFVEKDNIGDLGDELKAWFNDGALIVPVFDKSEVFPEADEGEYVLSVGVEEDEVLVVDPHAETGGVYFIDQQELLKAMDEDHGYIVVAPQGTTAQWRIKNDLLYSDKNYYEELSKTLEARLTKILRQGRILKDVMAPSVRNYMESWRTDRYVSRLWKPEKGEEDEASGDN